MKLLLCLGLMILCGAIGHAQTAPPSEKVSEFVDKISALLNGASVTLRNGIANLGTGSGPGGGSGVARSLKYELDISNLTIDTTREARSWLFAGSMPALVFVKDSIRESPAYKTLEIHVKATNGKEIVNVYPFVKLKEVESCLQVASRYANGLIMANLDSVTWYSNKAMLDRWPAAPLIEKLKAADQAWGRVGDMSINGFRIESANGKDTIYVSLYLERNGGNQLVELWIDPLVKKVARYDM